MDATAPQAHHPCPGPDPDTRSPRHPAPLHACDCHAHVFWPAGAYPLSATREFDPPSCPPEAYLRMLGKLGIERAVIVHPSVYGTDNRASLDAIRAIGLDRARGVAVISGEESEAQLRAMDEAGMRGVRLSSAVKGGVGIERLDDVAARIAPFGWHVDLHLGGVGELEQLGARLAALPVPVVLDHLGRVRAQEGAKAPGFQALLRLLGSRDNIWVKLSSFYRLTARRAPFEDMAPMARALVETRPDRLVWGSNWPHPHFTGQMPNDADLFDVLFDWAPQGEVRDGILAANPARLYGFDY